MYEAGPQVLGLDWRTSIAAARWRLGANLVVQGNLDPSLVLAGSAAALEGTRAVLDDNGGHPGHIFNLGHGVDPSTDPGVLAEIVNHVHQATEGAS
jgi:uroporphyrinogen decarboxylase